MANQNWRLIREQKKTEALFSCYKDTGHKFYVNVEGLETYGDAKPPGETNKKRKVESGDSSSKSNATKRARTKNGSTKEDDGACPKQKALQSSFDSRATPYKQDKKSGLTQAQELENIKRSIRECTVPAPAALPVLGNEKAPGLKPAQAGPNLCKPATETSHETLPAIVGYDGRTGLPVYSSDHSTRPQSGNQKENGTPGNDNEENDLPDEHFAASLQAYSDAEAVYILNQAKETSDVELYNELARMFEIVRESIDIPGLPVDPDVAGDSMDAQKEMSQASHPIAQDINSESQPTEEQIESSEEGNACSDNEQDLQTDQLFTTGNTTEQSPQNENEVFTTDLDQASPQSVTPYSLSEPFGDETATPVLSAPEENAEELDDTLQPAAPRPVTPQTPSAVACYRGSADADADAEPSELIVVTGEDDDEVFKYICMDQLDDEYPAPKLQWQ